MSPTLSVRIQEDDRKVLDRIAAEHSWSVAQTVRELIAMHERMEEAKEYFRVAQVSNEVEPDWHEALEVTAVHEEYGPQDFHWEGGPHPMNTVLCRLVDSLHGGLLKAFRFDNHME